jgi:hypothetical protein
MYSLFHPTVKDSIGWSGNTPRPHEKELQGIVGCVGKMLTAFWDAHGNTGCKPLLQSTVALEGSHLGETPWLVYKQGEFSV